MSGRARINSRKNGACAVARVTAAPRRCWVSPRLIAVFSLAQNRCERNFRGGWVVGPTMKSEPPEVTAMELQALDRRIIRVDVPPAHAGITAALRRAFAAAAAEPCEHDFVELLRKLN
ncbi:MAG: hypothetical protein ABIS38_08995 [Sphingomicrobium sp.]